MAALVAPPTLTYKRKLLTKSAATARGCLLVYPVGKKAKQRVAVGDSTGLFRVFSIGKRLEPVLAFETPETVAPNSGTGAEKDKKTISAATLYSDQLFFIQGSVLHAYSRKGKPFFTVDTNVTEKVSALAIDTPFIFIAGDFMVTTMNETKEIGFYLSPDRVNDMCVYVTPAAAPREGERQLEDYVCCLACNDRVLRLIQSNKLMEEVSCEATLTTLVFHAPEKLLLYGTQSGSIGVLKVKDYGGLRRVGSFMPGNSSSSSSAGASSSSSSITSFGLADVNVDGQDELLVGYDDGTVSVFALQLTRSSGSVADAVALTLVWSGSVGERVTSVAGGIITGSPEQPDVLAHTYSGQVIAFTLDTEVVKEDVQAAAAEAAERQAALLAKQQDTQNEIERLRSLIARRTEELSVPPPTPKAKEAPPVLTITATFTLTVTLTPLEAAPMLSLVIFADVPLEGVMLRCSAPLTFVSTESAVVKTRTAASPTSAVVVATVSPVQQGGKRVEVQLWADEGVADTLQITAYSGQAPRTAQVKYAPLYALPLYERVSSDSVAALAPAMLQAMSRWIVLGSFTGQDVLEWMGQLLPDLADIPHRATTHRHVFVSDFLQSTLVVELDDAEPGGGDDSRAVFSCNSLVTLATVKRHVSQACAQLGVTITTREHVLFETAQRQLQQLYPVMTSLSNSQHRLQLLQGLRELQGAEDDLSFLPSHLQEVLASAEEVEVEAEAESHQEAYLKRAVAAIYSSLVYFKNHAPPLNDAMRLRLEAASCGLGFDTTLLERIFFPRGEQQEEAAMLETNGHAGSTYSPLTTATTPTTESAMPILPSAALPTHAPAAAAAAATLPAETSPVREASEMRNTIVSSPSASEDDEL